MKFNLFAKFCALIAVAALTACGGGGSGSSSTTPPTQPPAVTPGNLLTTQPNNPYPVGSPEAVNFTEINRVRIAGGFGAAVNDPVMDVAAKAHEIYLSTNIAAGNPIPDPHGETPGYPGFTGATLQARCDAAAIGTDAVGQISCGEDGAGTSTPKAQYNVFFDYSLATGHLQNLLSYTNNHIGMYIEEGPSLGVTGVSTGATFTVGTRRNSQASLSSDKLYSIVGVYPYDGMTGAGIGIGADSHGQSIGPNDPNYAWLFGSSILVQVSTPQNPVITKFVLRAEGAAIDTPTRIQIAGQMDGTEPTFQGWGILMPTVVLSPNTKYNVTFEGTVGGVAVQKSWSFTTGTTSGARLGG